MNMPQASSITTYPGSRFDSYLYVTIYASQKSQPNIKNIKAKGKSRYVGTANRSSIAKNEPIVPGIFLETNPVPKKDMTKSKNLRFSFPRCCSIF